MSDFFKQFATDCLSSKKSSLRVQSFWDARRQLRRELSEKSRIELEAERSRVESEYKELEREFIDRVAQIKALNDLGVCPTKSDSMELNDYEDRLRALSLRNGEIGSILKMRSCGLPIERGQSS